MRAAGGRPFFFHRRDAGGAENGPSNENRVRGHPARDLVLASAFGLSLAFMNLFFYEALVRQYGSEQVVRIKVSLPPPDHLRADLSTRVHQALRSCGARSVPTWHTADGVTFIAGPVDDLDALANKLDLGTKPQIDRATRTLTYLLPQTSP